MAPTLMSLPAELLETVSEYCALDGTGDSLLALRCTCRKLQAATRRSWLRKYIGHRSLAFEPGKVRRLAELVESEEFASAITSIQVKVLGYDSDELQRIKVDGEFAEATPSLLCMKYSSALALIFRKTPNLKEIHFATLYRRPLGHPGGNQTIQPSEVLAAVLLSVQASSLHLTLISTCPWLNDLDTGREVFEADSFSSWPLLQECFSRLITLEMDVGSRHAHHHSPLNDINDGIYFSAGLNHMETLTNLYLSFDATARSSQIFEKLTNLVRLPYLRYLGLTTLKCKSKDLTEFLLKHAPTLRSLDFDSLELAERVESGNYHRLLQTLRDRLDLEDLLLHCLEDTEGLIRFPGLGYASCDMVNADGYVEVSQVLQFDLHGNEEVKWGLSDMLHCMG